jgi:hypothetical protein
MLALYLGLLDADFDIIDAPELADALRTLAARYHRAADTSPADDGGLPPRPSSPSGLRS